MAIVIKNKRGKIAFTLAEVLITLLITGILVMLIFPPVIHRCNLLVLEVLFKSFNSRLQQALNIVANEYDVSKFEDIKKIYCGDLTQFDKN